MLTATALRSVVSGLCLTIAGLAPAMSPAAPVKALYGANGFSLVRFDGATGTTLASGLRSQYAFAVTDTIDFAGRTETAGGEHALDGTFLGTNSAPSGINTLDGASDGTTHYSVAYQDGGVYAFDADWTNAQRLFGTAPSSVGITYEPTNGSLWLADFESTTTLTNYSLTGQVLSSFTLGVGFVRGLAYETATDTFWANQGTDLLQFNKTGTILGTRDVGVIFQALEFSAASAAIPVPGALLLLATGLGGLVAVRRRKAV